MQDLAKIKRNVAKMVSMDAPEVDIDAYIASEGVTLEQVRAYRGGGAGQQPQRALSDQERVMQDVGAPWRLMQESA